MRQCHHLHFGSTTILVHLLAAPQDSVRPALSLYPVLGIQLAGAALAGTAKGGPQGVSPDRAAQELPCEHVETSMGLMVEIAVASPLLEVDCVLLLLSHAAQVCTVR